MNNFWGMIKLWIFYWAFWSLISYILRLSLKVKVQNWQMFLGMLNLKYFLFLGGGGGKE